MSTTPITFDQTIEQMAGMWDDLAGWQANFANGVVEAIGRGAQDAEAMLNRVRAKYPTAISAAIASREFARAAGDTTAANVWRALADEMSRWAFDLADDAKSAAQRLAVFETRINSGLRAVGGFVGPAFDIFGVTKAVVEGDGNKAGEATLSMGLGMLGGVLGGAGAIAFSQGAVVVAFAGGIGAMGGAMLAKPINEKWGRPGFDFLGRVFVPDSLWKRLEQITFGAGAARLDPSGAVFASMLLHRIDQSVKLEDLGRLFDIAGVSTKGRETVALVNQLLRVFVPNQAFLWESATDKEMIQYAGRIAAVTDTIAGGLRISTQAPSLAEARSDFAALLSLQLGLTVTLRLTDTSSSSPATAKLQQLYSSDYQNWLADKNSTSPSTFTDAWINDRITFMTALTASRANENDELAISNNLPADRSYEFRYINPATGLQKILLAENTARPGGTTSTGRVPSQLIAFGGASSDTLNGSDNKLADRLYGGAGADTLDGKAGADYLEGGADNDTLIGGDNDQANDTLIGGKGTDTYQFSGLFGNDTILDADGLGIIMLDGVQLGAGNLVIEHVAGQVWETTDKKWVLTQVPSTAAGAGPASYDLTLGRRASAGAASARDTITLQGWQNNQLSLNLPQTVAQTAPQLQYDLTTPTGQQAYEQSQQNSATAAADQRIYSAAQYNTGTASYLSYQAIVQAGAGADWIEGGAPNKSARLVLGGQDGDDHLFAYEGQEDIDEAIEEANTGVATNGPNGSNTPSESNRYVLDGGAGDDDLIIHSKLSFIHEDLEHISIKKVQKKQTLQEKQKQARACKRSAGWRFKAKAAKSPRQYSIVCYELRSKLQRNQGANTALTDVRTCTHTGAQNA